MNRNVSNMKLFFESYLECEYWIWINRNDTIASLKNTNANECFCYEITSLIIFSALDMFKMISLILRTQTVRCKFHEQLENLMLNLMLNATNFMSNFTSVAKNQCHINAVLVANVVGNLVKWKFSCQHDWQSCSMEIIEIILWRNEIK